jgi:enterochelin esterase-like enzyme
VGSNPTSTASAPTGGSAHPGGARRDDQNRNQPGFRGVILEPQSTAFFLLLIAAFGGLMWWLVVAKQLVFRVLAACLAFIPAMMFGVAAVNKYYDYYQNWNSAISDMTNSSAGTGVPASAGGAGVRLSTFHGAAIDTALAAQDGYTLHMYVRGRLSHIRRSVFVYLPPQYFQPSYRTYRFPAIELLHGFPGQPQDWITVVGVTTTLQDLIGAGLAQPAVLVMPDANGGRAISLQCLNQVRGPQDATYLAEDLPASISQVLRVQPPGPAWGIAGYSEGGFCAANLGLKYGRRFGYSGVLSGYFSPSDNQFGHPARLVNPFGGSGRLKRANTPVDLVHSLRAGTPVPQFWLGVGSGDRSDLKNAEVFEQLLQVRQPGVTLKIVRGGGHTMFTWRAMTPRLADEAAAWQAREARQDALRGHAKTAARHRPLPSGTPSP